MFVAAASLLMASCGNDDSADTTPAETTILLKKSIETDEDGYVLTSIYTYDGNKIISATYSDDTKDVFTYTNDNITQIQTYDSNALDEEEMFEYNGNGQVTTYIYKSYGSGDYAERSTYVYNTNGTVTVTEYTGTHSAQTTLRGTRVITVVNDNITKNVFTDADGEISDTETFTFDDKNNPLKNILGIKAINMAYGIDGVNNILTEWSGGSQDYTYAYTYNSNDFPVTFTSNDDGYTSTTQYFYE